MRAWLVAGACLAAGVACADRDVAPIMIGERLEVGADTGAGVLQSWPRVSPRHRLGFRVFVPQGGGPGAIPLVFDDSARFVGRLELPPGDTLAYREPLFARFGPSDSVFVFDGSGDVFVFGPDRTYARRIRLPVAPWDAAFLPDGRMVVSSSLHAQSLPLYLVTPDGAVAGTIGASDSAALAVGSPRRVLAGADRTVWSMPMLGGWRIERWGADGRLAAVHERTPEWYRAVVTDTGAPEPTLQSFWFDDAGRLWVLGKAVDAEWEDGVDGDDDSGRTIDDPDRVGDTMIEVFDPVSWEVVAEARFDPAYPFAAEPGSMVRVRGTPAGWHRVEIARIVLDTTRLRRSRP